MLRHYSDEMLMHMMAPDEGNSGSDGLRMAVFLGFLLTLLREMSAGLIQTRK